VDGVAVLPFLLGAGATLAGTFAVEWFGAMRRDSHLREARDEARLEKQAERKIELLNTLSGALTDLSAMVPVAKRQRSWRRRTGRNLLPTALQATPTFTTRPVRPSA
jgi:hypothetical protein